MDNLIATKLTQLVVLQEIDTQLNNILKLRGTLPEEVGLLEQDIEKLSDKIVDSDDLLVKLQDEVLQKKTFIKQSEKKIQQYKTQQMEVRNNREYDAITKELELQELDIQLAEKFLRTAHERVAQMAIDLDGLRLKLSQKKDHLVVKKEELALILKASEAEEEGLYKQRADVVATVGEPLYMTYERIRKSVHNNLSVVSIHKGACGGCCIVLPSQQKLEVYERTKIVLCEYCGRMLIASEEVMDDAALFAS